MELQIKRLHSTGKLPEFAHATDAGMDLFADESKQLAAGQRAVISTGIAIAVPAGYVGLIWDKSGLATKAGITMLAGVIDAGYRGEVMVAVLNTSNQSYEVLSCQKIAQLLIQPIVHPVIHEVTKLPAADRGENGFGSTGL